MFCGLLQPYQHASGRFRRMGLPHPKTVFHTPASFIPGINRVGSVPPRMPLFPRLPYFLWLCGPLFFVSGSSSCESYEELELRPFRVKAPSYDRYDRPNSTSVPRYTLLFARTLECNFLYDCVNFTFCFPTPLLRGSTAVCKPSVLTVLRKSGTEQKLPLSLSSAQKRRKAIDHS